MGADKSMRLRVHLIIIALILSAGVPVDITLWFLSGPSSDIWSGGSNNEMFNAIWSDGEFLYTCGVAQVNSTSTDFTLVKTHLNGATVWSSTWGGPDHEAGNDLCGNETQIIVVGWTESYAMGLRDAVIVQWDLLGNCIQNNTWGGPFYDEAMSIWRNSSDIYICGTTWSYGAGNADFFLLKATPGIPLLWNHTWGGPTIDYGCSVVGTDTAIYTAGYSNSYGAGNSDFVLIKWDAGGNIIWNRTWGGPGEDTCQSVWSDGNFLYTCGSSSSFGSANRSTLVKWDINGNIIWNHTRGGTEMSNSLDLCGNSGMIYTCGWMGISPTANPRLMMEQWDSNGGNLNTWLWGNSSSASFGRGIWNFGEKFYVAGYTSGIGGTFDYLLVQWDINAYIPGLLFLIMLASLVITWIFFVYRYKRKVTSPEKKES